MPIVPADATILEPARNAYAFPQGLVVENGAQGAPEFAGQFPFDFEQPGVVTDLEFDHHLTNLLRDGDPLARRRGLANVVYWGHITAGYARHRVSRLVAPIAAQRLPLSDDGVLQRLHIATEHADEGAFGEALGSLFGISQLSGLAFASKTIAFLDPERAGILDKKIMSALFIWSMPGEDVNSLQARLGLWAIEANVLLAHMTAPVNRGNVQRAYQAWCVQLQASAATLNAAGSTWTDPQLGPQLWRAIDIERAIFQLAA